MTLSDQLWNTTNCLYMYSSPKEMQLFWSCIVVGQWIFGEKSSLQSTCKVQKTKGTRKNGQIKVAISWEHREKPPIFFLISSTPPPRSLIVVPWTISWYCELRVKLVWKKVRCMPVISLKWHRQSQASTSFAFSLTILTKGTIVQYHVNNYLEKL